MSVRSVRLTRVASVLEAITPVVAVHVAFLLCTSLRKVSRGTGEHKCAGRGSGQGAGRTVWQELAAGKCISRHTRARRATAAATDLPRQWQQASQMPSLGTDIKLRVRARG